MFPLLFLVLFTEAAVALLLMVKVGPPRELAMRDVEQAKAGKGPATVKALFSSVAAILKIYNRGHKLRTVSPMDQVLWRTHLLEASLIGYTLLLAFVIDRLHNYLRKEAHHPEESSPPGRSSRNYKWRTAPSAKRRRSPQARSRSFSRTSLSCART